MEYELIQLAKTLAWPELRNAYGEFQLEISKCLTTPELQLCQEVIRKGSIPDGSTETILDWLTGETLRVANHTLRGPLGVIKTSTAKTSAALVALRETITRLEKYPPEEKREAETAFRDWLQRSLMSQSIHEEPSSVTGKDPIQEAMDTVARIQASAGAFLRAQSDSLVFPFSNFRIESKPKTPIGIDPFDTGELEGGAEEDSCIILAGESNIGKSHLGLFSLSSIVLLKEPVMLFSGEDSDETTRRRVFAHFLRKPERDLLRMTEAEREKEFTQRYGDRDDPDSFHFHIVRHFAISCVEEGKFRPKAMEEKIDAFEQITQRKVKAVMADYLQKMSENQKNSRHQRDEELENIVNQIKDISQNRKLATIIISQVPSHAAGGNFEFLNIKQAVARAYAATWGAHYIVTMNRTAEETKRLSSSEDKRPRLNLALCKNKNGPLGVCYALGYPERAHWEFFRSKSDLQGKIDSDSILHARATMDPRDYTRESTFGRPGRQKV